MNALDRLIAYVAPGWGVQRVRERVRVRYYDAARPGRGTYGWVRPGTSSTAEVYGGLVALRNGARELVRNNPSAKKAIRTLTDNAVGTGIVAQARTPDKALNRQIDALWKRFVEECDVEGRRDFYGMQSLAVRSFFESGESLILNEVRPSSEGRAVPLTLSVYEGDYLDHTKTGKIEEDGGRIVTGVEFGPDRRRRAYWLFPEHPGDLFFGRSGAFKSSPVPADRVVHLYEELRPGQVRGVPSLHAVMLTMRTLGDYEEAELVRKRIEACLAAFVLGDDEADMPLTPSAQKDADAFHVRDGAGNPLEEFTPGMIGYLRGGKDVKVLQPASTGGFSEYKRSQQISVAAGLDLTYELLTGDLSRVNYSSIKAGLNEFRRCIEVQQWLVIVPIFCRPVWRRFIDVSVAAGRLPRGTPYDVEWTTPRFESVDPLKEAQADIAEVRAMLKTPQEALRRRGYDPDQVLADHAEWHRKLVSLGIVSDADAAQTGKAGAPAAAKPDEGGDGTGNKETSS